MALLSGSGSVKVSLIASFTARFFGAIVGIIAVPLYIKLIGIEAYGLIGLFASMQAIVSLFDFGLGPTIIREFGKSSNTPSDFQRLSDLAKASEVVYLLLATVICSLLLAATPWIVDSWININDLNPAHVKQALYIGVIALSVQWPATLYSSGLIGLQKQVALATFSTAITLLRVVSSLLALYWVAATIEVFFAVNLVFSIVQVITLRMLMWYQLPKANSWVFCKSRLLELKGFIGIMSAIALCSVLLTQLDKLILSNVLTLKEFGVYTLVGALAGGIYISVSPIFSVIYPKLSALIHSGREKEVLIFYHKSAQLLSLILIPVVTTIIFFSNDILLVWTGDLKLTSLASLPLIFLVVGNALNGMMNVPYALQLAYGKPQLALINNISAISFLLPSIYFLATRYGISGGALAWLILNILYVIVSQYVTHRKLFNKDLLKWYWVDVGIPFILCITVTYIFYKIMPLNITRLNTAFYLGMVFLAVFITALLSLPEMRQIVINNLRAYKASKNEYL